MENNKATLCGLKRENFQKVINGKETDLYVLTNENGMEVAVTNYGGGFGTLRRSRHYDGNASRGLFVHVG